MKFRVKLHADVPRVIDEFHNFNEVTLGIDSGNPEPRLFETFAVSVVRVELVRDVSHHLEVTHTGISFPVGVH